MQCLINTVPIKERRRADENVRITGAPQQWVHHQNPKVCNIWRANETAQEQHYFTAAIVHRQENWRDEEGIQHFPNHGRKLECSTQTHVTEVRIVSKLEIVFSTTTACDCERTARKGTRDPTKRQIGKGFQRAHQQP